MELVDFKGANMGIHTLPPESWDKIVCKTLIPKILLLLSVNIEKNPKKIAATELMIKETANRMTPVEIEKAFLMYVKGELQGLEPMEGNLSPIVFNKVVNQYKRQKTEKHEEYKVEISDEEKAENEYLNIIYAWDEWKQEKKVPLDYHWVYDSLKDRGLLKVSDDESKSLNDYLRETYPNFSREKKLKKGKCLLVERFFEKLKVPVKELL